MATYTGTWDHDNFVGTNGDDTFVNIKGGDTVDGGAGSDTISIDLSYTNLAVNYNAVAAATATGTAPLQYMSVKNVEHLGLLQTGGGDDSLKISVAQGAFEWQAGAGTDTLKIDFTGATSGIRTLSAGAGNFSVHADQWGDSVYGTAYGIEAVQVTGSACADDIRGTDGNDVLKGGAGDDLLDPGHGGSDEIDGGAGFDKLAFDYSAVTTRIDVNAAGMDWPLYGTNLIVAGQTVHIVNVEGLGTIKTGSGNDRLQVDASVGAFTWWGGTGSDELFVNYGDAAAGVTVSNVASSDGWMTRLYTADMPAGFYGQAYQIESLTFYGSAFADNVQGTLGNDNINGKEGADRMEGLGGNDAYVVDNAGDVIVEVANGGLDAVLTDLTSYTLGANIENLAFGGYGDAVGTGNGLNNTITGNEGNNTLKGLAGDDTLDGKLGADTMIGGLGNDTYYVDNAMDLVIEATGQGTDRVISSISFSLAGTFIENLQLTGPHAWNATGNSLANMLNGNGLDNILDGGYGADIMAGGYGNDRYIVDNVGDVVTELKGQGTDEIAASVSYSLAGGYVEKLLLTGSANLSGTGNALDNTLRGNLGNNVLNGAQGNDILTGNAGADTFVFTTSNGHDTITDFSLSDSDTIDVSAYTHGTAHAAYITQVGSDVQVDLGAGNIVTVSSAVVADVASHMVW